MENTETQAQELKEKFKFGDLIRIKTKGYYLTCFFKDISLWYPRKKYKDATISIYGKVCVSDLDKVKNLTPSFWNYNLSKIEEIELLNRVLNDEWLNYEVFV